MRIIPKKTKIGIEIFKGINFADFLVGLLFFALALFVGTSTVAYNLYISLALIIIGALLLVKIGDEPNYMFFLSVFRYLAYNKSYRKGSKGKKDIVNISAFRSIEDGFIVYDDYYGAAIEIPPVEFRFFSSYRRSISIDECLGNVLRGLNMNYAANLVKIERRVPYDGYIENEKEKMQDLRRCYECGLISEEEFQAKCEVIFDRGSELQRLNSENRTVAPYYYLVFFDADKNQLRMQVDMAVSVLERGEMKPKRLDSKGLALFLKYSNDIDFDEKELEELDESEYAAWAMPETLQIKPNDYLINDMTAYTMAISNYPLRVGDAWLAGVMSIPATKVVVKLRPMDKQKTIKNIDRSISELRGRYSHTGIDSALIEIKDHIQSLGELLSLLQSDNEVLLNTDVYVTCYDVQLTKKDGRETAALNSNRATISNMRNVVRRIYRETDLRLSNLQFNQTEGYIGSQISGYDPLARKLGIGIPGSTAAAMYPWIYAHVQDPLGIKLGSEDGIPVFIDMFRRDSERVNSNVVIVGKSGSGKSYCAKSILVNLAADNSKIFVLDPENEYSELAENLHGKFINVGNAQQGRMNPFHIITTLEEDDTDGAITGSYASHMQFLEEFYKQILPDCEMEALEYLNTLTHRAYMHKGITAETSLRELKPEDYPTFSDIYDEILRDFQSTDNEYLRGILRTLMNYVAKFSSDGRNANIWNGPSTVTTEENFTVFNFQSLLAGGNRTITNAQMLLVMKYIDNEIIKNREYNTKYGTNRKIVVVIDEAHVFIDDKYPIALDFMYQLAKRIRKYNGMQIVITQNIKDFVGSEDISRKSSAIINACQYSYIFSLAPNDMSDLCKLYEKAGGINEHEQDKIVTAQRGNAFVILGPTSRSSFQIEVPEDVVRIFEQRNFTSHYFSGKDGQAAWNEFLGESRKKHLENRKTRELLPEFANMPKPPEVTFIEVSEEEYRRELEQQASAERTSAGSAEIMPEQKAIFDETAPYDGQAVYEAEPDTVSPSAEYPENVSEKTGIAKPSFISEQTSDKIITHEKNPDSAELAQIALELRRMMDTAGRMMDSMGRFSYDAMMKDLMSRLEKNGSAEPAMQGAATALNGKDTETDTSDLQQNNEKSDAPDETDLNNDFFESLADDVSEEVPEEQSIPRATLMDYLHELEAMEDVTSSLEESDEENEADYVSEDSAKQADGTFQLNSSANEKIDIMAFLQNNVAKLAQITALDEMEKIGESKRTVSLDELEKIIKKQNSQD